jgi:hypothetical protein
MLSWFTFRQDADIGILTGKHSNIMVVDIDTPKACYPMRDIQESRTFLVAQTPRNGRHYYFRYHPDAQHGIRIWPNVDLPHIVKVYNAVYINEVYTPIRPGQFWPDNVTPLSELPSEWDGDPSPPTMWDIAQCDFIKWFKKARDNYPYLEGRYPVARAYASNVARVSNPDLHLGNNYRHTSHIYTTLRKPIRCATFMKDFNCPHFNEETQTCRKTAGATSPYGLAKAMLRKRLMNQKGSTD